MEPAVRQMQDLFSVPWIKSFNIHYFMGIDGISFPLVILTSFICMLAMGASWNINKHVKAYCILFLLLETGMLGVFLALDFFLFYVFWEVMLLPMYFLIGVWGGPRKEYAAIKFFLYTLLGSVFMLIAILMLYFNSDLRLLSDKQLASTGVIDQQLAGGAAGRRRSARSNKRPKRSTRSISWRCQRWGRCPIRRSAAMPIECSARPCNGGRSCCCSSASRSRCPPCRCTPGCPMRTSKRRRRSR